jgi:hypothetical protein
MQQQEFIKYLLDQYYIMGNESRRRRRTDERKLISAEMRFVRSTVK